MNKKDYTNKFYELFEEMEAELGSRKALGVLGDMVDLLDLPTSANMIRCDYEPYLSKESFVGNQFEEGNENAGFITLNSVLKTVEEMINCDESSGNFKFQDFIREETEEEKEIRIEEGGSSYTDWYVEDDRVDRKDLNIQFEIED